MVEEQNHEEISYENKKIVGKNKHFQSDVLLQLKGQAIPLLGYHLLREHVLPAITGDFQSSILYWAGKDLAELFSLRSMDDCLDLFSEIGWGLLQLKQSNPQRKLFELHSPFFTPRAVHKNESSFALECGFLTAAIAQIEEREAQGSFIFVHDGKPPHVQFTILLQDD